MILTQNRGNVVTSENINPNGFRIKASRKAFEILSAGLYSDKVRAIIRELSTNAADAHVSAGKKDEPFEVHLPNQLEPWFAVTDYGTGLSDEAMHSVYTTYFESDKTDSNEYTGCLGLGSKSPFSYTDSFTVESRHNGIKRIYNAYLNEDGLPSIVRLAEEGTDEPNGLTVKFPVRSGDFREFYTKAEETLKWFRVRPVISGYADFEFTDRDYLLKNEKFAVNKAKQWGKVDSFVVMGNVAYPINAYDFLNGEDGDSRLRALVEWGVELYVSVGDVDISASREKLSYDKRTIRFLRERLTETLDVLGKEVTKNISSQPNLWSARRELYRVQQSFKGFNFTAEWNGNPITSGVKVGVKEVEVTDAQGIVKKTNKPLASVEHLHIKNKWSDRMQVKKVPTDSVIADGTVIIINDERGGIAAVRRYMQEKRPDSGVYFILEYDANWLQETGIAAVAVKASTLPKPVRVSGAKGQSQKSKLYRYVPEGNADNGSSSSSCYWEPVEVDLDEGGVYVEISYFNFKASDDQSLTHPSELKAITQKLALLGRQVTVYGIRPSDKALLDKSEGEWSMLREYVQDIVKDLEPELLPKMISHKELEHLVNRNYYRSTPYTEFGDEKFIPASKFGQYVAAVSAAIDAGRNDKAKVYSELRHWAQIIDDQPCDRLLKMLESLNEHYPLLKHIEAYARGEGYIKALSEYINLIDEK